MQSCGGFTVGLLWDCYGIAMGLFYVGHIVAADAFPSAVVEEDDFIAIDAAKLVAVRVASVPIGALFDAEIAVSEHLRRFV